MIISTLNYSSIKSREKEETEKKRKAAAKAQEERIQQAQYTTPSRPQGTQTDFEESLG
jgi:Flp pilus assembly protein TadB